MRIAISALSLKPGRTGGGETVLRNLIPALPAVDPQIEYVLFVNGNNRHLFTGLPPSVVLHEASRWASTPGRRIVYELLIMPLAVRRLKIDLFFAVNQIFAPWMPCRVSALVQNLFYYHYREFSSSYPAGSYAMRELRYRLYAGLGGICNRRASHVVAVSECTKNAVIEHDGIASGQVHVVPLALSATHVPEAGSDETDRVRDRIGRAFLLYVGALAPYKNLDRVLVALARREMRQRELALVCIGFDQWGYGGRLRELANELGIGDDVYFLKAVPHDELGAWYAAAEALVLLSGCEAFPLTLFEAMARGTPVIASNLSSVPEIVGDAGLIVDPQDEREVAGAIERVCEDRGHREELAHAGRARVQRFDWADTASKLVRLWRKEISSDDKSA